MIAGMHPQNEAILKSLVSVAWADGEYGAPEREMLDALLVAFDASDEQAKALRAYAETKRTIEDIPIDELSSDDLRVLVKNAVLLTYIDGQQDPREATFVEQMARYIGIPQDEAAHLITSAGEIAKRNLRLL